MLEADLSFHPRLDQAIVEKSYVSYEKLFKQYGTDSTTVANTFEYYKNKQEELLDIYRIVLDSLNRMAEMAMPPKKDSVANPVKDTLR